MKTTQWYALEIYVMKRYNGDKRRKYDPSLEIWGWESHYEFDSWDDAMDCVGDGTWPNDLKFRIVKVDRMVTVEGIFGDYLLKKEPAG
jgi:hypothetical protein